MTEGTKALRHEGTKGGKRAEVTRFSLRAFSCSFCLFVITGCANNQNGPTTRPLTIEEKQAQLMNDPFGYKSDTPNTDISGGDLTHFDKDAMKKDVDHVLNP